MEGVPPAQALVEEPVLAEAMLPDLAVLEGRPLQPAVAQPRSSTASHVRVCLALPAHIHNAFLLHL